MHLLASFPVLRGVPFLWIAYALVGVLVPLTVETAIKKTIRVLKGRVSE